MVDKEFFIACYKLFYSVVVYQNVSPIIENKQSRIHTLSHLSGLTHLFSLSQQLAYLVFDFFLLGVKSDIEVFKNRAAGVTGSVSVLYDCKI